MRRSPLALEPSNRLNRYSTSNIFEDAPVNNNSSSSSPPTHPLQQPTAPTFLPLTAAGSDAPTLGPPRPKRRRVKPRRSSEVGGGRGREEGKEEGKQDWRTMACQWSRQAWERMVVWWSQLPPPSLPRCDSIGRLSKEEVEDTPKTFKSNEEALTAGGGGSTNHQQQPEWQELCLQVLLPRGLGSPEKIEKRPRPTPESKIPEMMRALEEEALLLDSHASSLSLTQHPDEEQPPSALFYQQYCWAAAKKQAIPRPPHLAANNRRKHALMS
eukprot:Protomagalhaensia_wolfi_Nauph_80__830@NODE_147_length_3434_cov_523_177320_g109_i0_p2_GENE_NODE_147_length_3434_cov_523_177320_g109_i0NODE_147_length_3434_cov_523_177320_g109_i0_p2_ORF_typecomplete_len270_score51_38DUF4775/PF16001_5/0_69_NODE_147_length_3434_cov_523_177320_g109_i02261035